MTSAVGIGTAKKAGSTASVDVSGEKRGNSSGAVDGSVLLPPPFTPDVTDDLATSLALMMMQQKHEDRVQNDAQARAASKAQDEAQARKIAKMHELADDTFAEGLVEGITEGVSAVATGASAVVKFEGELDVLSRVGERHGKMLLRNASLIEAGGTAFKSAGKFIETSYKRDQELDRADTAVVDQEIERAKGAVDAASTQSRRDQDDIRETMNAVRSYTNAKTQLRQAGIIRA